MGRWFAKGGGRREKVVLIGDPIYFGDESRPAPARLDRSAHLVRSVGYHRNIGFSTEPSTVTQKLEYLRDPITAPVDQHRATTAGVSGQQLAALEAVL